MFRTVPALLLALSLGLVAAPAGANESLWEARGVETYHLEAGESVQFRVDFDALPVRAWILAVDGDQLLCDLNVLNVPRETLLYQKSDESRHRVRIPWGMDEAVAVTLTADTRTGGGVYTVRFLAPSADTAPRAFGYRVNRGLEALDAGRGDLAEKELTRAMQESVDVGVAALLLAGLYKEQGDLERAAGMLDVALREPMPDDLIDVRLELARQFESVLYRLPPGLVDVDRLLEAGLAERAAAACLAVIDEGGLGAWELSEVRRRHGRALHLQGHLVPAQERYDEALAEAVTPHQQALAMHRLGLLQRDLGNPVQARTALRRARALGLPADLDAEAAAQLTALEAEDDS